jgi:membrane-associated protease RseP (regulator of RpoE activity)
LSNDASLSTPQLSSGGSLPADPVVPVWHPPVRPARFQHVLWKHVLLFVLTLATATLAGADHYAAFASEFGKRDISYSWGLLGQGLWYSATILAILGAHEMGHYVACRRYRVDATLPFFLPLPPPFWTGTLGAVIRIREAFPNRRVLFDIGVAGPIAGFVVLVPALFLGLAMSTVVPAPAQSAELVYLGEPLLFKWATRLMFGALADGFTLNMHPMVFAAWFGMLATALNLLPFGQLDGGHITYATLGRWSTPHHRGDRTGDDLHLHQLDRDDHHDAGDAPAARPASPESDLRVRATRPGTPGGGRARIRHSRALLHARAARVHELTLQISTHTGITAHSSDPRRRSCAA